MNDNELDEMLNRWDVPPASPSLRRRVQAGLYKPRPWYSALGGVGWKGMFAGLAAGAAMFLVVVGVASPQSIGRLSAPIPYTVDLEYISHNEDGSSVVTEHATTFLRDGHEWILTASFPNSALQTAHLQFASSLHLMLYSLARTFMDTGAVQAIENANAQRIQRGCMWWGDKASHDKLIGHEAILNHETSIIQSTEGDWRDTKWLAPDLGCMTLKTADEQLGSDGRYRLKFERRPLKVNINRS